MTKYIKKNFIGLMFVISFLITSCVMLTRAEANGALSGQIDDELIVPSPMQIRDFAPQPNQLMIVTYANERIFIYRIQKIIPKPDCNQVKYDEHRRIRITTQAVSQAYEYVLEPMPIMVSEWVPYAN